MSRPCSSIGGVALRRVAVLLADDAFELAQAHAVLVRHVGLVVEPSRSSSALHSRWLPMITVSMTR